MPISPGEPIYELPQSAPGTLAVPVPLLQDAAPERGQVVYQDAGNGYYSSFIWDGYGWRDQAIENESGGVLQRARLIDWSGVRTSPGYGSNILTIPYGVDAGQYADASPEERLAYQALGEQLLTRDTNRDVIAATAGSVLDRSNTINQQLLGSDLDRLAQERALNEGTRGIDVAAYANQDAATTAANAAEAGLAGGYAELYDQTGDMSQAALAGLSDVTNQRNALGAGATGALALRANEIDEFNRTALGELEDAGGDANFADETALERFDESGQASLAQRAEGLGDLEALNTEIRGNDAAVRSGLQGYQDIYSAAGDAEADEGAIAQQQDASDLYRRYAGLEGAPSEGIVGYRDAGDGIQEPIYGDLPGAPAIGGLSSREAVAYADPDDIAAQAAARDRFGYLGSDAADLDSARAGATADPWAVAAQQGALGAMGTFAGGGGDIASREAQAAADQRAIDSQYDALDLYRGRSDTSIGAQERLLFEQARRNQENERRSGMATVLRGLAERGALGGGSEVAAYLGLDQSTGQDRVLADMMALANAEQRAERNTGYFADLAGSLRSSSFGEAARTGAAEDAMNVGNRTATMDAIAQMGDLGTTARGQSFGESAFRTGAEDEMALANQQRQLAATGQQGDLATGMREQGFEEERNRGEAYDQMQVYNRDTSLDALGSLADLGTTMRDQSFGEDFQTGEATDAISRFNAEQGQIAQRWNADYQAQQDAANFERQREVYGAQTDQADTGYDIAGDVFGATRDVAGDQYDRMGNLVDTALAESDAGFTRQAGVTDTALAENQAGFERSQGFYDAADAAIGDNFDRGGTLYDAATGAVDRTYGRTTDLADQARDSNAMNYAREADYLDSLRQASGDYYGRNTDLSNQETNLASLYTDQGQAAASGVSQTYQGVAGESHVRAALAELEEEDGSFLSGIANAIDPELARTLGI